MFRAGRHHDRSCQTHRTPIINHALRTHYDVIILGAGGAGLFCAAQSGRNGLRALVLDHASEPGKKIRISGGGRCNFTNIHCHPRAFISDNPHFVKSALARFRPADFIALVDRHHIAWHEKTLGQLFCDGSAGQIVTMLLDECAAGDVTISLSQTIDKVGLDGGMFTVEHEGNITQAPQLVIATGGLSIPKMGASDLAFRLARQFGLPIIQPRPGLVPFTLDDPGFTSLSGVATPVSAQNAEGFGDNPAFSEGLLFTHKGLSGPAMLQISSYWQPNTPIRVDFLPQVPQNFLVEAKRLHPKSHLQRELARCLPARLAAYLTQSLAKTAPIDKALADLSDKVLRNLVDQLQNWNITPTGTEGYAKAEVTVGGLDTGGFSSQTMESKLVPGLYGIGEAMDVTGWLGGYNFQWAWASAFAAAQAIGQRALTRARPTD